MSPPSLQTSSTSTCPLLTRRELTTICGLLRLPPLWSTFPPCHPANATSSLFPLNHLYSLSSLYRVGDLRLLLPSVWHLGASVTSWTSVMTTPVQPGAAQVFFSTSADVLLWLRNVERSSGRRLFLVTRHWWLCPGDVPRADRTRRHLKGSII